MKQGIILLIILLSPLGGCVKKEVDPLRATVALVNDEIITVEEVSALLPEENQEEGTKDSTTTAENALLKRELLNQLIDRKMLLQEASRLNIKLSESEISQQINLLQDGLDEKAFTQRLSDLSIARIDWEKATRENLIIEKLLDQLAREDEENTVSISDEMLHNYYDNNQEQWRVGKQLKLRQIVVDNSEKADMIHRSILNGADFAETWKINMRQAEVKNEGDMGYVTQSEIPIEFDPLFKEEIGSISKVIKTPFGYHIVMIEDKRPEQILPFEEIKEKLHQTLLERKREHIFSKWIEKLRHRTEVRINEELLKTLS